MIKFFVLVLISVLLPQFSFSQISGKITDAETGEPVSGANIVYSDERTGTVSDINGEFETGPTKKLIISAIGYKTSTVKISPDQDYYRISLDPEGYRLQEVVVEAFNRSRRLLDVPGSLSLMPAGQIEIQRPVTIVPVLNQAPGIFAHSGALNTSRITIRGIGARVPYATGKIRAYLNNIPLTNGSGVSIIEDIDPSVMERIEIIKGPATSVYGAGLGGTIIITPKKPEREHDEVTNSFQAGHWGLVRNNVGVNTTGRNMGLNLQYNHTRSNGYRQNNQYWKNGLTAITQASPGENTDVTFIAVYTSLKAHIPSSIDSLTYANQPQSAAANWLQTKGYEDYDKLLGGISADYRLTDALKTNISIFSTMLDEKEMRPFDVLNVDRLSGGARFKIISSGSMLRGSYQILGGGELYGERYKYTSFENIGGIGNRGEMISDNKEMISYYNVFAQTDLDFHRLNLSAGINLNSSQTDYTDLFHVEDVNPSGKYSYGKIYSPRISGNYRYYRNNSVFLTASHGFSPPSLSETLTPEGFINTDIKPETSWNIESGIRGNLFRHSLFYDINVYRMQVENLLVAERVGEDAWVGKNAGESVHRGLELELQMIMYQSETADDESWWSLDKLTLSPNLSLNNFRFSDFIDEGVDYSGNRLPGIPDIVGNIILNATFGGGLYAVANFRYVGRMPLDDANSRFTENYSRTSFTAGYKNRIFDNLYADAFLIAGNIYNTKYASMILVNAPQFQNRPPRYYYPGNPRNIRAGVKLSYRFN
ncbi:MAG: TonB-dependent receptor [Bacteroidales bacterium]